LLNIFAQLSPFSHIFFCVAKGVDAFEMICKGRGFLFVVWCSLFGVWGLGFGVCVSSWYRL